MPAKTVSSEELRVVGRALSAAVGAALVLDAELRILLASDLAVALIGSPVPFGASAPDVLCGSSPKRVVARALAEGRAIEALVPHPSPSRRYRMLKVRSLPLRAGTRTEGWLLLLDEGHAPEQEPRLFHGMWTRSPAMLEMFRIVERVAPEDVTVLVRGETGTGKELVAQALHQLSPRRKGPFAAINCAALPANLLESELFGHVRGAFTGALRDTPGHFQRAHQGTLFLDEVAELPLELQAKLLRVLETRTVWPVGGRQAVPIDVRIVSATHRALRKEVEAGRFRADLMYRLRVIPIFLPPLRERKEDIALLCDKLLATLNQSARRRIERVAQPALALLERYDWPGNVRELHNVLSYAYTIGDGPILQLADLPHELMLEEERAAGGPAHVPTAVPVASSDPEAQRIANALVRAGGNKNRAAELLGISRVTLWRRLRALGLLETRATGERP
jgi:transcriptional regulator with PAS, ATPase and Fis domain